MTNPIYSFLKAAAGNWHNAIFLECRRCTFGKPVCCSGFLLAIDGDGKAVIISIDTFRQTTDESIDKAECAAILDIHVFEQACSSWLVWSIDDTAHCPFLQLTAQ